MLCSRRQTLQTLLNSGGSLGLAAFVSGLPPWLLAATASEHCQRSAQPAPDRRDDHTSLVVAFSAAGAPINANAPGTYDDPAIVHPAHEAMRPTAFDLGGQRTVAALPFAKWPAALHERTAFIHHATGNVVHQQSRELLRFGQRPGRASLFAWLASCLAPALGTSLREPLVLGYDHPALAPMATAQQQPTAQQLLPSTLTALLTADEEPMAELLALRERTLKRVARACHLVQGGQQALSDRALSAADLAARVTTLQHKLATLRATDTAGELASAAALIALNVAPVVFVRLPFGGDNHRDPGLVQESAGAVAGAQAIASLHQHLSELSVEQRTTFVSLGAFGRTLHRVHLGEQGRDHNGQHNVAVLAGPGVQAGVVGGLKRRGADFGAAPIDPLTGSVLAGGGIAPRDSLPAVAATLAAACGVAPAAIAERLPGARIVEAALRRNLGARARLA